MGYGIDAYWNGPEDRVYLLQAFKFGVQYRVGPTDLNPLLIQLRAELDTEDGKVVFHALEHPEWLRRYMNNSINEDGCWP